MYREMRRKDRELTGEEALEILKKGEYGVLSMADEAGIPYGVPISYAYTEEGIYFHMATEGRKLEYMQARPGVSFCVVGNTEVMPEKYGTKYESVIVTGTVEELAGEDKIKGLMALVEKYSAEYMEGGRKYAEGSVDKTKVFCLKAERITGKSRRR